MKDIIEKYQKEIQEKIRLKNLLEKYERRIVELNNRIVSLGDWYESLFIPMCNKLEKVLPNIVRREDFGPFGIQAETSAYFTKKDGTNYVLKVIPNDKCDWFQYDTGMKKKEYVNYEENSIAKLNGFDKIYKDLPTSSEEIVKIVLQTKFKKEV